MIEGAAPVGKLERLQTRIGDLSDKRARDAADLRAHLANAQRDLTHAREHLMLIDTKLDILEGAATVLDNRTRAILSTRWSFHLRAMTCC